MMNIIKRIVLILMIIFLMLGASGCGIKHRAKREKMVSYINDKYTDDSFECVYEVGGHLGSNVTKLLVKSKKYPDKAIYVIRRERDGNVSYSDTYLNVKFEDETRTYIENALSDAFGPQIYVLYTPNDLGSMRNGSSDTEFSEFISDNTTRVYFNAVVVMDDVNEDSALQKVKAAFANGVVLGDIFFVNSSYIETFNEDAISLIKDKKYTKALLFIKSDVDQYKLVEWKDGV